MGLGFLSSHFVEFDRQLEISRSKQKSISRLRAVSCVPKAPQISVEYERLSSKLSTKMIVWTELLLLREANGSLEAQRLSLETKGQSGHRKTKTPLSPGPFKTTRLRPKILGIVTKICRPVQAGRRLALAHLRV